MQLRDATRQRIRIRAGVSGPSGSGKTAGALRVAYGLTGDWGKIAVIDTENRSSELYSNTTLADGTRIGTFKVISLGAPYSPERYIEAIEACEQGGVEVAVLDSITHEWNGQGGVLQLVDELGGSPRGWKAMTPRHEAFKEKILRSSLHIITTVRRVQEYDYVKNESGKTQVVKLGLKEQTREGWEYELTINFEVDMTNKTVVHKDRTQLFVGKDPFKLTEQVGSDILTWCNLGIDADKIVHDAIAEMKGCTTVQEMKNTKARLEKEASFVLIDPAFIAASTERYNEIMGLQP